MERRSEMFGLLAGGLSSLGGQEKQLRVLDAGGEEEGGGGCCGTSQGGRSKSVSM